MPIYSVQGPDGNTYSIEGPEGATRAQVIMAIQQKLAMQPEPAPVIEPPKPEGGFFPSIKRGFLQLGMLGGDILPAMVARAVGADEYAEKQLQEAAATQARIEREVPAAVPSYKDIAGVGDAWTYAKEAVGETLASIIPTIFTGGTAGLLARPAIAAANVAAKEAAEKALLSAAMTAGPPTQAAVKAAQEAAVKAGVDAARKTALKYEIGGGFAGSALQNVPEVYQNILEETGKESIPAALSAGLFNAALDTVLPAKLLAKIRGAGIPESEVVGAWYKRGAKGLGKGFLYEGATEAAQEASSIAAESFVAENPDVFTSKNLERVINAGLKGGIGGGAIVGATDVALGRAEPKAEDLYSQAQRLNQEIQMLDRLASDTSQDEVRQEVGVKSNSELVDLYREQGYSAVKKYQAELAEQAKSASKEEKPIFDAAIKDVDQMLLQVTTEEVSRRFIQPETKVLTEKDLNNWGIPRSDPIYKELLDKDFTTPQGVSEVISILEDATQRKGIRQSRVDQFNGLISSAENFLATLPGGAFYGTVQQPSGEGATVAGEPGAGAPSGRPPVTKPISMVRPEQDVGELDGREEQQPAPVDQNQKDIILKTIGFLNANNLATNQLSISGITDGKISFSGDLQQAKQEGKALFDAFNVAQKLGITPQEIFEASQSRLKPASAEPAVSAPPVSAPPPVAALPKELAGAKPRYGYKNKQFQLSFDSDIDKALFITAQATPSKRDADYRSWLQTQGFTPEQIASQGQAIRESIKQQAATADPAAGPLKVVKRSLKPETEQRAEQILKQRQAEPTAPAEEAPEVSRKEAIAARRAELIKQLDAVLKRILAKYGLKDVKLNLDEAFADEGSYSRQIITMALNLDNPVRVLRHEAIHALKDMGFFTGNQWNVLEKRAKDEWVPLLKQTPHTDTQSRYDAYVDLFTQEATAKGLSGKEAQDYIDTAIIEEAVADAFGAFDTKAPPGMISAIVERMRKLFRAIKEAFNLSGVESAEDIFGKIEAGKLKPTLAQAKETPAKASLRAVPLSTRSVMESNPLFAMNELGLSIKGQKKPGGIFLFNDVRSIANALNNDTLKNYGRIDKDNTSAYSRSAIARAIADEVSYQVMTTSETGTGLGWYSNNYPRAVKKLARRFPELRTNPHARAVFSALLAITSNGEKVSLNAKNAVELYENLRDGKPLVAPGSRRSVALENNLKVIKDLLAEHGTNFRNVLLKEYLVKDINAILRAQGKEPDGSYLATSKLPAAAIYFGPKLGAFYANLEGAEGYLTMDMWWTRSINRMRGLLMPIATESSINRFRAFANRPSMTKEEVVSATIPIRDRYEELEWSTELEHLVGEKEPSKKNERPRWVSKAKRLAGPAYGQLRLEHDVMKLSNTIYKNEYEMLEEAPFGANDREFMYRAAREAQKLLKQEGIDLTLADIQAALWYYEKRLYQHLSGRKADDIGYDEAISALAGESDRPAGPSVVFDTGVDRGAVAARGVPDTDRLREADRESVKQGVTDEQVRLGQPPVRPSLRSRETEAGRGRGTERRSLARLEGAPSVPGFSGPDPRLVEVAEKYAKDNGIKYRRQAVYVDVNEDRARRIADAYADMPHAPNDPKVREAYENMIRQTRAQYDALVDAGYKFWFIDLNKPDNADYVSTPWNAMRDIRTNKVMGVFPTNDGFGSSEDFSPESNPLLADTGLKWPVGGLDGELSPVLANDLFRAVHDAFGHGLEGAGFRARGEENAWQAHVRLFKGSALGALTSETRGQNSWLNYGPYGDKNRTAKIEDTVFADQKTGLMPEWTWTEGIVESEPDVGLVFGTKQPGASSFEGTHYGNVKVDTLSADKYGTGMRGAERRRLENSYDDRINRRVYFYIKKTDGQMPTPESGVGGFVYTQKFDNILGPGPEMSRLFSKANGDANEFESSVIDAGYDGYAVPNMGMMVVLNHDVPVQYLGTRVEVERHGAEEPQAKYSLRDKLGLYSELEAKIETGSNKAPAASWKAYINGLIQKGVKPDEIEWSGVRDWLDLQKGMVTKEELLNYLKQGGVKVEEVQSPVGKSIGTRDFRGYQLPGGENYREVLLTLPRETMDSSFLTIKETGRASKPWGLFAEGEDVPRYAFDTRARAEEARTKYVQKAPEKYKSVHWDQPNVLAHIRVNDRTDADGNKVLFVEEIQSDWGQEGKKKGFSLPPKEDAELDGLLKIPSWERTPSQIQRVEELNGKKLRGVPLAPFVTKTEGWLNLALKRVMVMAAEGGYDKVAFVNGDQSAERYDLSKQVSSLWVDDIGNGEWSVRAFAREGDEDRTIDREISSLDDLEGLVGKEVAQRAVDQVNKSGRARLSGLDLKVGGEGMKTFYDTIVPTALKKLLPKVGGGQMGTVGVQVPPASAIDPARTTLRETIQQPGFDVTPAMRDKVQTTGLPRFSLRGAASWTDKRIDSLIDEYGYIDGRTKAYAARIRPSDFVYSTTPDEKYAREIYDEAGQLDIEELTGESQTPFLYVETSGDNWQIVGHEGRHRMAAMDAAGITDAPVVLVMYKNGYRAPDMYAPETSHDLEGQNFPSYETAGQGAYSTVRKLTPLSYKYKQQLKDEFGKEAQVKFSLRTPTKTPQFKFWFNKSQIVDADGNPKVMYHGTSRDITEFKPKQADAIFLTDDPETAARYSQESLQWLQDNAADFLTPEQLAESLKQAKSLLSQNGYRPDQISALEKDKGIFKTDEYREAVAQFIPTGPNILPLYVSAQNVFDFTNPAHVDSVMNVLGDTKVKKADFARTNNWTTVESPEVQEAIRSLGFDGFYVNEHGAKNLAVYTPNQVKSVFNQAPTSGPELKKSLRAPTTDAFKRWFGDSKVVDADDNPLVVYHGTGQLDDNTADGAIGQFMDFSPVWFAADAGLANVYAAQSAYGDPTIYPAFLSVQRPLRMSFDMDQGALPVVPYARRLGVSEEDIDFYQDGPAYDFVRSRPFVEAAQSKGYDGFIVNEDGVPTYAVFDSTQIKSATGNIGTYDVTSPDIRKSIRITMTPAMVASMNKIAPPTYNPNLWERILDAVGGDSFVKIRQRLVNRYEALAAVDRAVAKQLQQAGGVQQFADQKAESAALMSDLSAGVLETAMGAHDRFGGIPIYRNGIVTVSNFGKTVKGPVLIFKPLSDLNDPDAFRLYQTWAAVKRGTRLSVEGREQLVDQSDRQAMRDLATTNPNLVALFQAVQSDWITYNNGLVKLMEDTGVITPEMAKEYIKHGDYFPFYRLVDVDDVVGPKMFTSIGNVRPPRQLKGGENPLGDFFENIVRNSQAAIQASMKNVAAQRATSQAMKIGQVHKLPTKASGPSVYRVLENGKEVYYRSQDPLFIEAIKALNMPELPFIGLLSAPANILRNLVTKDPAFMLANMMRDSLSAYTTSGVKMTPIVDTLKNFGMAIAKQSPEMQMLYSAGVLGGYDYAQGIKTSGREFEKRLREVSGTKTTAEKLATPFTSLWGALEAGTRASDAATRIEVFKRVLAETGNQAEAYFQALEVMNFNRKGNSAVVRLFTAAVPFLNARMQGLDLLFRTAIYPMGGSDTERAVQRMKTFWVRGMTLMAISSMYWLLTHDDEEYKKQEQETRDNFWLIPSLGIKIPIPFEVGVIFKVIPERIMNLTFGNDTNKDFTDAMKRQFLSTFMFNPIPQTFLPIIENATNYSFFTGRPIIGQGLEDVAQQYQIGPGTSRVAELIGKSVGYSPIKIDHLIKGYTGTIGQYAADVFDAMYDMTSDAPKAAKRFEQMPVIRRFALDPEARGSITAYYGLKDSVDEVVRTSNMLERSMNFKEWGPYASENMKMLGAQDFINDLEKDIKEYRQMRQMILSSSMSSDSKKQVLISIGRAEQALTTNIQSIKKSLQ